MQKVDDGKKQPCSAKIILKGILPPPIRSFMREVGNILDSIWRAKGELERQTDSQTEVMQARFDAISGQVARLEDNYDRLYRLFEALNEENRRLFSFLMQQEQGYAEQTSEIMRRFEEQNAIQEESNGLLVTRIEAIDKSQTRVCEQLDVTANSLKKAAHADSEGIRGSIARVLRRQDELLDPALYPHALTVWYQNETGEVLDLDNPQTYNEKIQWLKLYDRSDLKSMLSDKVRVRSWVAEKIGQEYLTKLYGVYRCASEIDFDALPNRFVLKANHGSGWNAIVRDKASENLSALRAKADLWLKADFSYSNGYELQYSKIPRRLIVEEMLENADHDMPDYKMWCFSGRVHYIEYISGRGLNPSAVFFDRDWKPTGFCTEYRQNTEVIPRPSSLDAMIHVAEVLAEGFPHVRVDLYLLDDGTIKFGEMTFSTSSGAIRWNPPETDLMMGELLTLPRIYKEQTQ